MYNKRKIRDLLMEIILILVFNYLIIRAKVFPIMDESQPDPDAAGVKKLSESRKVIYNFFLSLF